PPDARTSATLDGSPSSTPRSGSPSSRWPTCCAAVARSSGRESFCGWRGTPPERRSAGGPPSEADHAMQGVERRPDRPGRLAGRVAIVTGASRGIGRAIAERLARERATVVVNYVKRREQANDVAAAIRAAGGTALPIQGDMSRVADIRTLVTETIRRLGRL